MGDKKIICLLLILILFLIFGNSVIFGIKKNLAGSNASILNNTCEIAQRENAILKSKISELENLNDFQNLIFSSGDKNNLSNNENVRSVFVYSRYPFNLKNEFLINLGEDSGISIGDAVVLPVSIASSTIQIAQLQTSANFILIGKVQKVYKTYSSVQTIFDPNFKLAVKIGKNQSDSLLTGGPKPGLTLIASSSEINPFDVVYSADPAFRYGLVVGEVSDIKSSSNSFFKEALIFLPYDLNMINIVGVLTK